MAKEYTFNEVITETIKNIIDNDYIENTIITIGPDDILEYIKQNNIKIRYSEFFTNDISTKINQALKIYKNVSKSYSKDNKYYIEINKIFNNNELLNKFLIFIFIILVLYFYFN